MGLTGAGYNCPVKQSPQAELPRDCARKMNKTLTTIFALAVASVTAFSHAQEVKGDVKAGEKKIAMCIG